jgi:hypothetical protein
MAGHAKGTFEVKSFDEDTVEEFDDGSKLTRARIVQTMDGGLDGESTSEFVMHYRPDGTASFAGYVRFVGQLDDRSGSYVQQATGSYDNIEARTLSSVVLGSGTGALSDLNGQGVSVAPHGMTGTYTFDYELPHAAQ